MMQTMDVDHAPRHGCASAYVSALLLALLMVLASGCEVLGGNGGGPPSQAAMDDMDDMDDDVGAVPDDYRIGVDDVIEVSVWRNPDLSVTLPVRPDGRISVPLVGDVQAGGKQPGQVASEIQETLQTYIREPKVTVLVRELRSHDYLSRVRVTGAVTTPLSAAHRPGMTLLDLVLDAGGITEFAAPNRARLYRRQGNGDTRVFDVRLNDILQDGDLSTNFTLRPGDIVSIPERLF